MDYFIHRTTYRVVIPEKNHHDPDDWKSGKFATAAIIGAVAGAIFGGPIGALVGTGIGASIAAVSLEQNK